MHDPFRLTGRTCLSFSGGRTSGYMLKRTIEANLDQLHLLVVCFANTGREDEATLRFVRECGRRWGIAIVWLEWRADGDGYAVVDFEKAARDGEPFEALIRKRNFLPNPVTRFCTSELKIRTMHRYLASMGWKADGDGWDQFIGIRADEPARVAKIRARAGSTETKHETMCIPLADAGVGVGHVQAFWALQDFGLELASVNGRTLDGNCDLCFLKPVGQIVNSIKRKPARATWWIRMQSDVVKTIKPRMVETGFFDQDGNPLLKPVIGRGATWGKDLPSYERMAQFALDQADMFDDNEAAMACFCGD